MTKASKLRETENLQEHLRHVVYLLSQLKLAEELAKYIPEQQDERAEVEQKQNLAELQSLLDRLHPADVAHILEALLEGLGSGQGRARRRNSSRSIRRGTRNPDRQHEQRRNAGCGGAARC